MHKNAKASFVYTRGVARIFQRGRGGEVHTVQHPGYFIYGSLHVFGPENGVCNYLYDIYSSDLRFFAT